MPNNPGSPPEINHFFLAHSLKSFDRTSLKLVQVFLDNLSINKQQGEVCLLECFLKNEILFVGSSLFSTICRFLSYHPSCHRFHSIHFSDNKTNQQLLFSSTLQWSVAAVFPTSLLSVGLLVFFLLLFSAGSFHCSYLSDGVKTGFHPTVKQIQTNRRNVVGKLNVSLVFC